jgi:hypothetical protein
MSDSIDWNFQNKASQGSTVEKQQQPRKELRFLKLVRGTTYKIRPLGRPVVFNKFIVQHNGRWNSAICQDPANCVITHKYNISPQERYAVNIIDRADGLIKILEFSPTIYNKLREVYQITKLEPGGKDGGDFEIFAKPVTLKDGKQTTRFEIKFLEKTPFTDDEKKMLTVDGLFELKRIYKVTPEDQIEQKLYPKQPVEAPVPTVKPVVTQGVKVTDKAIDDVLGF